MISVVNLIRSLTLIIWEFNMTDLAVVRGDYWLPCLTWLPDVNKRLYLFKKPLYLRLDLDQEYN